MVEDITQVIRDRLACIGMEIEEALRESHERCPGSPLPADERVGALDVQALPQWPCCHTRGVHAVWCRYSVPRVPRARQIDAEGSP